MDKTVTKLVDEKLLNMVAQHKNLCVLNAVFSPVSKLELFSKNFEDRYFTFGLSSQNLFGAAAGMALRGKMPFVCADAAFLTGAAYNQFRNMIIQPNLNVKIIGLNAGISLARHGFGYHAIDDLGAILQLPNIKVFSPADDVELEAILHHTANHFGPVYVRVGFESDSSILKKSRFTEGSAEVLKKGRDVAIFTHGAMVGKVLNLAKLLAKDEIDVMIINVSSIKPLHEKLLIKCASEVKFSVVVEDHFVTGGLGTALAKLFTEKYPTRLFTLGFDNFTDSDEKESLYKKFSLNVDGLYKKMKALIKLV